MKFFFLVFVSVFSCVLLPKETLAQKNIKPEAVTSEDALKLASEFAVKYGAKVISSTVESDRDIHFEIHMDVELDQKNEKFVIDVNSYDGLYIAGVMLGSETLKKLDFSTKDFFQAVRGTNRVWTSGKFTKTARYVRRRGDDVDLWVGDDDGKLITIKHQKLSKNDRDWIKSIDQMILSDRKKLKAWQKARDDLWNRAVKYTKGLVELNSYNSKKGLPEEEDSVTPSLIKKITSLEWEMKELEESYRSYRGKRDASDGSGD